MNPVTLVGLVRGVLTAVLFGAFIALWFWAWSAKRRPDFHAAAMLPLEDETAAATRGKQP